MATILDKELRRQITVDGRDYTVAIDPDGLRLVAKGKRNAELQLRWLDLLSGEAALAVALNASLTKPARPAKSAAPTTPAGAPPSALSSRAIRGAARKTRP